MITINKKMRGYVGGKYDATSIPCGIQMTFANGNTISIQFGYGNYCENRDISKPTSKDAEIAIWNSKQQWYTFESSNQVKGYCSADEVAEWILFASTHDFEVSSNEICTYGFEQLLDMLRDIGANKKVDFSEEKIRAEIKERLS